jgi:hypothetical protein
MNYNGHPVVGFGEEQPTPPTTKPKSEWPMLFATSIVSAAAGWAIDETARYVRGRRRR